MPITLASKLSLSPHAVPLALQKASVMLEKLPGGMDGAAGCGMCTPPCTKKRTISTRSPASVPSDVTNCVTAEKMRVVSTAKPTLERGDDDAGTREPDVAPGSATGVPRADLRKHMDVLATNVKPTHVAVALHVAQHPVGSV